MLSKTDLQSFLQCPRRLWLAHNDADGVPAAEPSQSRREKDGNAVGEKAREALSNRVIWPKSDADKGVACALAIQQLAQHPADAAVEVPLVHNGLYARTDALIPLSPGHYVLQETKASSFPLKDDKTTPGKPESHHLDDVAIQAWVMANAGLSMARAELNLLDGQWRYPGTGDYGGLFRALDVTELIAPRVALVPGWLQSASDIVALPDMPAATIGPQCKKPQACPYMDKCRKLEPPPLEHPLTLLPDVGGKALAKKLAVFGFKSLLEPQRKLLIGTDPKRSELYQRIQLAHQTGKFIWRIQPVVATP